MIKRVTYKVSWVFGGRAEESRWFDEWEPAAEFYTGMLGDRRCDFANLVEVTESEVRCFKREAPTGCRRAPPPIAPATGEGAGQNRPQGSVGRG